MRCEDDSRTGCGNEARYVGSNGRRLCGLCDLDYVSAAIRDADLPLFISEVEGLLCELDSQQVPAGTSVRKRLKGLMGL